jgi:hypothetical protein
MKRLWKYKMLWRSPSRLKPEPANSRFGTLSAVIMMVSPEALEIKGIHARNMSMGIFRIALMRNTSRRRYHRESIHSHDSASSRPGLPGSVPRTRQFTTLRRGHTLVSEFMTTSRTGCAPVTFRSRTSFSVDLRGLFNPAPLGNVAQSLSIVGSIISPDGSRPSRLSNRGANLVMVLCCPTIISPARLVFPRGFQTQQRDVALSRC